MENNFSYLVYDCVDYYHKYNGQQLYLNVEFSNYYYVSDKYQIQALCTGTIRVKYEKISSQITKNNLWINFDDCRIYGPFDLSTYKNEICLDIWNKTVEKFSWKQIYQDLHIAKQKRIETEIEEMQQKLEKLMEEREEQKRITGT